MDGERGLNETTFSAV